MLSSKNDISTRNRHYPANSSRPYRSAQQRNVATPCSWHLLPPWREDGSASCRSVEVPRPHFPPSSMIIGRLRSVHMSYSWHCRGCLIPNLSPGRCVGEAREVRP